MKIGLRYLKVLWHWSRQCSDRVTNAANCSASVYRMKKLLWYNIGYGHTRYIQHTSTFGSKCALRTRNQLTTATLMHFSRVSLREAFLGGSCSVNGRKEYTIQRVLCKKRDNHRSTIATALNSDSVDCMTKVQLV